MTKREDIDRPFLVSTIHGAGIAFGLALALSYVWFLLTWRFPDAVGWHDIRVRLYPFEPGLGDTGFAPLRDWLFLVNSFCRNLFVLGVPSFLVSIVHRGAPARLATFFFFLETALNLSFYGVNLSPEHSLGHRLSYASDIASGVAIIFLAAMAGSWVQRRLLEGAETAPF